MLSVPSYFMENEKSLNIYLLDMHTAPQRCQPERSGTLDFLLDLYYCDLDMTISVAK